MNCADSGVFMPFKSKEHKVTTMDFFATHLVFSLDEAAEVLAPPGGRAGTVERLKHHLETGRLKLLARGIYAVVPPGIKAGQFQPDPFLTAVAVRPDAVFSHHSALELLGAAHSIWNKYTLYTEKRRRPLRLDGTTIHFLEHPKSIHTRSLDDLGVQRIERRGRLLKATGPERTLIEGFRRAGRTRAICRRFPHS